MRFSSAPFLILGLLFISICSGNATLAEDRKLKIGVIAPLSGSAAWHGESLKNGARLLKKENPEFDNSLEVFYEDSASDLKKIALAYQKLVSVDKVDLIFSVEPGSLALLAAHANNDQIPFFSTESELHLAEGNEYVSLFQNESGEFGRALWDEFRRKSKKNIALVQQHAPYFDTVARGLADNAIFGESVVVEVAPPSKKTDFRSTIAKLKKSQFDLLGVFFAPPLFHEFLAQAQAAGITTQFFGAAEFASADENKEFKTYLKDALIVLPQLSESFQALYKKEYATESGIESAARFYDFLNLTSDVLKTHAQPITDRREFVKAMRFEDERQGVCGPYVVKTSSRKGVYYSFPIAIYKYQNDTLTLYRLFERPV